MKKRFIALFIALSVLSFFAFNRNDKLTAEQAGAHIIQIHIDGKTETVVTTAKTVGEALKESNAKLAKHDKTEPELNQEINSPQFSINVYRARPITVSDGPNNYTVVTAEHTPENIAKQAGFETNPEDKFSFRQADESSNNILGTQMVIQRSKKIKFELYGKTTQLNTHQVSVADFLAERKINLDPKDEINVPKEARISEDMLISIARVDKKVETAEEEVKFSEEQIKDVNQPTGYKQVKEAGKNGKKLVTYETVVRNGGAPVKTAIKEVITEQPVKQVVVVGAKSTNSFTGDFAGALARLRSCEGSYTSNTGNGYYGAYQFDISTWANYGGYRIPSDAPPAVQDEAAWRLYQRRGWQPWPSCRIKMGLQDIYR